MRKLTLTGKNVEEILTIFEEDMNIKKGEYDYLVIDKGSSGFLGFLSRDAVVEVTIKKEYYERKLKEFLENVVRCFDEGISVEVFSKNNRVFIAKIKGEGIGKIIGKHGKGLGALQHIATIFLNRLSDIKITVIIDAGDYREKRKELIKNIVVNAVEKLRNGAKKIELDPMFSFERRLVHEFLKRYPDVFSYSEGVEPYRYVVIERRGKNDSFQTRKSRTYNNR
ncbi:single-stranded DNA-binding protein [Thermosipho melanesiensis]|uniref:RNA-binding protein KhpB n=2 Tax=Thermosipho melanesiensis TaxID=46541 RepID=A6LNH5_THEM4|nr:single-stranded nucleic acid binding R3H domain protein [Thermosipho melanesiensis BI429]APT74534.1 single-stranded DNA-binding protein [Thermosipho melanesiensis]OOC36485.1 single-stranded DNA-binding protein [Thermosipho melanesiensis]OOC37303.1 single-stranded DNA-binding protein [Thermosipho melanesiensis]OOC38056.1 single-stranded DNA-binding protein [Thermosipho melanesiensis]